MGKVICGLGCLWICFYGRMDAKELVVCLTCPFADLSSAVKAAMAGDVVEVQPGTYPQGNLIIDKSLTIRGIGYPVLRGNGKEELITITANGVVLEGFELRDAGKSQMKDLAAVRVRKGRHFIIRGNRIQDAFFGIYIEKGVNGRIESNQIYGTAVNEMSGGNAIHAWYADSLEIFDNQVTGHRDGIYLEFVNHSTVVGNTSWANVRYGLHFMFSNDDTYGCNVFRKNGAGVAVMFSKRIQMYDNLFELNWGTASYGLLLKEIYDAKITGNRFLENTIGIFLEGATRVEYRSNQFFRNGWALQMTGGCIDNAFTRNEFSSNTLDLVIHSRINNNTFNGNYWSEYTGYDLNRDGVGDVPHPPVKLFSYVLNQVPESIVLLRSFFIDLLNFSEKVSPSFTPQDVFDHSPLMKAQL